MTSTSVYELIEACHKPGCPVCRLEHHHVQRYLEHQFYENVNKIDYRHLLRQSMGFCREHAWQIVDERLGDVLGIAILHQDLIGTVLERLERSDYLSAKKRNGQKRHLPEQVSALTHQAISALTPHKRCPACHQRDEMETFILSSLMNELGNSENLAALRMSDGLCLTHLRACLRLAKNEASCERLLSVQREKMEGLYQELGELIRKNDYRSAKEELGVEKDSWMRAVGMVVGGMKRK